MQVIDKKDKTPGISTFLKISLSFLLFTNCTNIISLYPGSRNSETNILLPILLDFIKLMNKKNPQEAEKIVKILISRFKAKAGDPKFKALGERFEEIRDKAEQTLRNKLNNFNK